ncbi:unnamed protein product [Adineta ricciae]|uniref:Phage tail collar domain-containing protein n=2 Tax=Adineta ricciae TaxID=249248 RepID=A0A815B6W1_ADIRI|nr:unnamed protein product [Adineta ricciae]
MKEVQNSPSSQNEERANRTWFLTWVFIGALVSGIVLGVFLTLYLNELLRKDVTTSTTTTSTSTSTTTTTESTTSTTSSTSTSMYPLVPPGMIMLWSGSTATVPLGWAVCDGTQGTPDLRDRFVLGSGTGSTYAPTQTGGSSSQTPTVTVHDTTLTVAQMPSHSHGGSTGIEDTGTIYYDINSNPCSASPLNTSPPRWINTKSFNQCGSCQHQHSIPVDGGNQPHTHTADITSIDVTPPFIALLYIMKL